jgi:hypothetical protein
MPCIVLFFTWVCISLCPSGSVAGILSIETQTSVQTTENQLEVTVKITNNGDEPAYNTQINLIVLDEKTQGAVKSKLDPGKSDVNTFTKTLSGIVRGRHPWVISVDFHDANLYPFSALSGSTFFLGKDVNPDIAVIGDNITLDKEGVLNYRVKNMGSDPRNLSAHLFLPKEFSSAPSKKTFQIDARTEKNLSFEIRNFSARYGASYPLYCYFEYDNNDFHYTAMANVIVTVTLEQGWFRSLKRLWIGTIIILIVSACGILIFQKKTKSTLQ